MLVDYTREMDCEGCDNGLAQPGFKPVITVFQDENYEAVQPEIVRHAEQPIYENGDSLNTGLFGSTFQDSPVYSESIDENKSLQKMYENLAGAAGAPVIPANILPTKKTATAFMIGSALVVLVMLVLIFKRKK